MVANPYGRLCTEFYALDKPFAPPDALDFYLEYARRARGPILEPMCGTGRFLLPMLAEGLDVEGLDYSREMLAACRTRALELGLSPVLHESGIEALPQQRKYDLVFIPSGSFSLLTDGAQTRATLRSINDVLLPGGTFVVEIERLRISPSSMSGTWGGRWIEGKDGAKIVISWLTQYSAPEAISRSLHRYELIKDGALLATEFEDFNLKFHDPEAFTTLLTQSGFSNIQQLKPYESVPPDDSDDGIVFVATKAS
jgi:SAM-dependent methyltransferase